ncbi:MAG: TrkH family potassium uptake protein [Treponema sp.]|nr:TrkH family potassium uptake protein [Treponema sp.]
MKVIDFIRIISILLAIVGLTFLIPIIVALIYGEYQVLNAFIIPMATSFVLFLVFFFPFRNRKINLSTRSTFVVVAGAWIFTSLMGAFPFYFSNCGISWTNAFFESVSGFSTTGATVIDDVEILPHAINMWRCMTHWLGGMGVVTLTVALLPLLGVGGFQLIKAETTGPEKGKVTAKITTTAKALWLIYFAFTVIEAILLKIFGMDWFDASAHAFSTLGTGGFSTKNSSIAYFDSAAIDITITVFMFLAGINFSLFYYLITKKTDEIKNNSEFKSYVGLFFSLVIITALCLLPKYHNFFTALRYSSFQIASLTSTTGFGTSDFTLWPVPAQLFCFMVFFVGGSSGSTSGGVKVIRWVILFKQAGNEIRRMLHPHGIFTVRLNGKPGRKDVVFNVAAFFFVYLLLVTLTTFIGCFGNLDLWSSFTGALSMVGNIGPGFGQLGPSNTYSFLPSFLKWWYCFAMLAGRLELYTMLIFFVPAYWKK